MPETIIKIRVGDLVCQKSTTNVHLDVMCEDRTGLTGVVVSLRPSTGEISRWSPMTAEVLWSDGILMEDFLVAALEKI
jgi:hypothetical protein